MIFNKSLQTLGNSENLNKNKETNTRQRNQIASSEQFIKTCHSHFFLICNSYR